MGSAVCLFFFLPRSFPARATACRGGREAVRHDKTASRPRQPGLPVILSFQRRSPGRRGRGRGGAAAGPSGIVMYSTTGPVGEAGRCRTRAATRTQDRDEPSSGGPLANNVERDDGRRVWAASGTEEVGGHGAGPGLRGRGRRGEPFQQAGRSSRKRKEKKIKTREPGRRWRGEEGEVAAGLCAAAAAAAAAAAVTAMQIRAANYDLRRVLLLYGMQVGKVTR